MHRLRCAKNNKNIYYDNNDNINQQLATESYSEADRSNKWEIRTSSVAKEKKNYEYRVDARIDISDCWCVT